MDPFEEFEFKPLTEGLGFHKKAEKIKTDIKSSHLAQDKTLDVLGTTPDIPSRVSGLGRITTGAESDLLGRNETPRPASQSISDLIASLPPSLDFLDNKEDAAPPPVPARPSYASMAGTPAPTKTAAPAADSSFARPQIFQPLGREDYKSPAAPTIGQAINNSISPTMPTPGSRAGGTAAPVAAKAPASQYRDRMDESFARAFPHAEKPKTRATDVAPHAAGLQPVPIHLGAAVLDGMVVTGLTTVLLVCILAITRVNLMGLLSNAQTDGSTQINLFLLFVAVLQMYMLTARSFAGASLGEWAFDLQLGDEDDQRKTAYPLLVAWRTFLVTMTGIIVLPILSLVLRQDITKHLTGLQLYRRP